MVIAYDYIANCVVTSTCRPAVVPGFLKLLLFTHWYVCVYLLPRELIPNGVI